ncbi:MAG: phospholipid-binding lipoprotein MlaA, partial [Dinoroseobacter sp.]
MSHCSFTNLSRTALLIGVLAISGCASVPSRNATHDPLEGLNRFSHGVNKAVDSVALRPASVVYDAVVPNPVVRGIDNFSGNLDQPGHVMNGILQGRPSEASRALFRFLVNTTFGLGGLLDPASDMGLVDEPTDFGETLHVWGFGEGAYLELPLLGPSTTRDAIGRAGNTLLNPTRLIATTNQQDLRLRQVGVADLLGDRADAASLTDPVLYETANSYTQLRSVYLQTRRFQLGGTEANDLEATGLDPFDDPFDDPF